MELEGQSKAKLYLKTLSACVFLFRQKCLSLGWASGRCECKEFSLSFGTLIVNAVSFEVCSYLL